MTTRISARCAAVLLAGVLAATLAGAGSAAAQDFLWGLQFGTANYTTAHAVTTDPAGNVIVAGNSSPYYLETDAWMAKYTVDGKRIWRRRIGTRKFDSAFALVTDDLGNIYLTGSTRGRLAGDNGDDADAWVAKYSEGGDQVWIRQFGASKKQPSDNPPADQPWGIAVDSAGNLFIAGVTTGLFQPRARSLPGQARRRRKPGLGTATRRGGQQGLWLRCRGQCRG